jgi:PII-like signaling protein
MNVIKLSNLTTNLPVVVEGIEEDADTVPVVSGSIDRTIQALCSSEPYRL